MNLPKNQDEGEYIELAHSFLKTGIYGGIVNTKDTDIKVIGNPEKN
jgi:hypothetical protein